MDKQERRTIRIFPNNQSTNHRPGRCRDCGQSIVWVRTTRPAWIMLRPGFEVAGFDPYTMPSGQEVTVERIYCDDVHLVTCTAIAARRERAA